MYYQSFKSICNLGKYTVAVQQTHGYQNKGSVDDKIHDFINNFAYPKLFATSLIFAAGTYCMASGKTDAKFRQGN